MSEQIQVREGVWRTRDGREIVISLRDFGNAEPTSFVWFSKSTGEYETWRDDGRNTLSTVPQPLDLIEYLRPLPGTQPTPEAAPEPQTTTDTLAQIEGQIDQAEPWERLAVALQQQLTESLAERDRLQRELTDMTNHAVELLESAQQARDERDLLAQRLITKHSEKALQKQVGRQQIEINTLKDQLQDMTADRDEQARLRETVDSTCRILGGEAKHWKNRAQEISDRMAVEITRAERAEAKARELQIELDAAGQQPAPADRSEQIERIWDESRERAVSEIIELVIPLQAATGTHAESVLQILPAVIRRWMDGGGCDDAE
jgi:hypothetical protein